MARELKVTIRLRRGRCRWCRCTYERPCAGGCGWADRAQTLCDACLELDRLIRTARGRQTIAEILQDQLEGGALVAPEPARRRRAS